MTIYTRNAFSVCLITTCAFLYCMRVGRAGEHDALAASAWITSRSGKHILIKTASPPVNRGSGQRSSRVLIDPTVKGREMIGFGASLTETSARLILSSADRDSIMTELFDPVKGIGISLVRIPVGSCDFSSHTYSYQPSPSAEFSIAPDQETIIPILKHALKLNPNLRIIACPWTAPGWMKDNGSLLGVKDYLHKHTPESHPGPDAVLLSEFIDDYADYLNSYISAYAKQGIPIRALSLQNEPMHTTDQYPSMHMPPSQAIELVNALAEAFRESGTRCRILIWEHNYTEKGEDGSEYIRSILKDHNARTNVWGSAWHGYSGSPAVMGSIAREFPDKVALFTEQTGEQGHGFSSNFRYFMAEKFLPAIANDAQSLMAWNIAVDNKGGPRLPTVKWSTASGLLNLDTKKRKWSRSGEYAAVAHFSKFVKPGAFRIASKTMGSKSIMAAAFLNPDNSVVIVVYNTGLHTRDVDLIAEQHYVTVRVAGRAAVSAVISGLPKSR